MAGRRWLWLVLFPVLGACGEDGVGPPDDGPTDSIPPQIVSVAPADGTANAPPTTTIDVTFSEPINLATAAVGSFFVVGDGEQVVGSYSLVESTVVFTPSAPLDTLTLYSATVTEAIRDPAGNALEGGMTWSFTTGLSVVPASR